MINTQLLFAITTPRYIIDVCNKGEGCVETKFNILNLKKIF